MSKETLALARRGYELFTSPQSIFSSEADAAYPTIGFEVERLVDADPRLP